MSRFATILGVGVAPTVFMLIRTIQLYAKY